MRKATNIESLRSLSLLYSTSSFRRILSENSLSSLEIKLTTHSKSILPSKRNTKFTTFLSKLYEQMVENYCNEYIYKNTILNELLLKNYSLETTTLLNELRINKSIADLVFVNGEVKLFEVKTDLDTLNRLDSQLEDYKKAVEKIYIVTNYKYIEQIKERYSHTRYGIIELTSSLTLKEHQSAELDKSQFDHTVIMKLLRKQEYLKILQGKFSYVPDVPNTLLFKECLKKIKSIDIIEFQSLAFKQLKQRKLNEPDLLLDVNTPKELRFLCHSLNLKESQYYTLYELLNKRL